MNELPKPVNPEEHEWEQGWRGHEEAQARRLAKLSFAEKLQWLEEADRLRRQLQAASKRK